MLEHFNNIGEIFYAPNDPFLSQFILLDKQFLVKATESLISVPDESAQGQMRSLWRMLSQRGLLHISLAKHLFQNDGDFVKNVLSILEHIGLICKCSGSDLPEDDAIEDEEDTTYIVPTMLPHGSPEVPEDEGIQKFYFDFGNFLPDALFSRLLARCQAQSDLQCETDQQQYLFREGGEFYLEAPVGRFYYWLRLYTHHPAQNLIEVSVKAYCGTNPFNLLRHLWQLVVDLRKQQFQAIRFHCGAACPFGPPHQCAEDKPLHILDEAHENQETFSEPTKQFMCRHREVTLNEYRQYEPLRAAASLASSGMKDDISGTPSVNGNNNLMFNTPAVVNINTGWIKTHEGDNETTNLPESVQKRSEATILQIEEEQSNERISSFRCEPSCDIRRRFPSSTSHQNTKQQGNNEYRVSDSLTTA
ncbi:uncharacterized protein [Amphiura filiformis]|uniref:uncharacterized protein n=1 Tax=Amphiura filiformis TaxID=82378 RepID=UPI003B21E543